MATTILANACFTLLILSILWIPSTACADGNCNMPVKYDMKPMLERYKKWLAQYGRAYNDQYEWELRFGVYQSNVQFIDFMNSQHHSYKLAENYFADMTNEEFKAMYLGFAAHVGPSNKLKNFSYCDCKGLPSSVDWRKKGAVTPIKDQGQCAVEGINMIKTGTLVSLSEQELVDCDVNDGNHGCKGGLMEKAFEFISKTGGLSTEANYPYTGKDDTCNTGEAAKHAVTINGYELVPSKNETSLKAAVAKQPVSVAIEASGYAFQFYSKGVFTGTCGNNLDHGVAVVGYGEDTGQKYWLVKNSWGTGWGEAGYIRMERDIADEGGLCGIAVEASYPV
ncbi:hypothetical protein HHK36_001788 [Tetracentron sinense]|uniref:Uncharacterized protein n=1 Tax=Tetracentron sinense TaxID=13715 RepID=A0A834ZU01_TETSI|nr:hypothetical protein HHK36_001788 [Tetracentron sinense]